MSEKELPTAEMGTTTRGGRGLDLNGVVSELPAHLYLSRSFQTLPKEAESQHRRRAMELHSPIPAITCSARPNGFGIMSNPGESETLEISSSF